MYLPYFVYGRSLYSKVFHFATKKFQNIFQFSWRCQEREILSQFYRNICEMLQVLLKRVYVYESVCNSPCTTIGQKFIAYWLVGRPHMLQNNSRQKDPRESRTLRSMWMFTIYVYIMLAYRQHTLSICMRMQLCQDRSDTTGLRWEFLVHIIRNNLIHACKNMYFIF